MLASNCIEDGIVLNKNNNKKKIIYTISLYLYKIQKLSMVLDLKAGYLSEGRRTNDQDKTLEDF